MESLNFLFCLAAYIDRDLGEARASTASKYFARKETRDVNYLHP
jgi:hypothetical protein